jgi:large subunit ribosomal protein L22
LPPRDTLRGTQAIKKAKRFEDIFMATLEKKKAVERKARRAAGPVRASLRNLSMSARKIRVIADGIRNRSLEYAFSFLSTQKKACCGPLKKLLESAAANADARDLDMDNLSIAEIIVDKGPIRKKFMPRAQGRATKIRKQSAHIQVILSGK